MRCLGENWVRKIAEEFEQAGEISWRHVGSEGKRGFEENWGADMHPNP